MSFIHRKHSALFPTAASPHTTRRYSGRAPFRDMPLRTWRCRETWAPLQFQLVMRQAPRVRCLAPRVRPTTRCTSVRLPPVPLRRTLAVWSRSPSDIIPPKAARQTPPPTPPSTLNALGSLSASLIGQSSEEEAATFRYIGISNCWEWIFIPYQRVMAQRRETNC